MTTHGKFPTDTAAWCGRLAGSAPQTTIHPADVSCRACKRAFTALSAKIARRRGAPVTTGRASKGAKTYKVRLSADEDSVVRAAATARKVSVNTYLRMAGLAKPRS